MPQALVDPRVSALRRMPELRLAYPDVPDFPAGDIVLIFAHADDELPLLGQLAFWHQQRREQRIRWIVVSDCSRGFVAPNLRHGRSKADIRRSELNAAAAAVGLEKPTVLGLPDGRLARVRDLQNIVRDAIGPAPAMVLTHDIAGFYGHVDHIAVHDAVMAVLPEGTPVLSQALPRYFRRLLIRRPAGLRRRQPPITHKFDITPAELPIKIAATLAYQSQKHVLWYFMQGLAPDVFYRAVPREFFHLKRAGRP
ncbi:MAG: PIG-L deacetylase family protein [Candidatus Xenobia bacterium]